MCNMMQEPTTMPKRTTGALDETFNMRVPGDTLRRIDEWRRRSPDLPTRAEAARRLIEIGLRAPRTEAPAKPRRPKS
jgi:hypothetical protein